MQSLELGQTTYTSPSDLKPRRRYHKYTATFEAYLASWRRHLAPQNLQPLKARLISVGTQVAKAVPVLFLISLAAVATFAAWIILVVLYEIVLGLGMVPPKP